MTLLTALALAAPSMQSFEDCDDYDQALTEAIVEQLVTYDVGWYGYRGLEALGYAEPSARAGAEDSGSAGPATYSGTNVQEQGVDELDWVKTDGRFIYMLNGDELAIVKSWPVDEAEKVGRLPLDGQLRSLFIQGDRALVLSYVATDRGQSGTRATLVDLRDRTRPRVLRTLDMDGWMTSGRLIGDHAYLVMNANTAVPQEVWNLLYSGDIALEPYPWDGSPGAQRMALEKRRRQLTPHVARILQKQGRDERLMRYSDSQSGWMPRSGTLLSCSDIHTDGDLHETGLLSVVHVSMSDPSQAPQASAVMGGGWTVYASLDNLYVAANSNWGWWFWGGAYEPGTDIHKFQLNDGDVAYSASGHVDGWLMNQFAMSEYDGNLRVAATAEDWWWGRGSGGQGSLVAVLADDNEGRLRTIGQVDGIAPGEMIYGVRFDGDRGYVVTFRQVDPLHVVDLSTPEEPVVRGELQIPGYSSYLHPMGDGYLLAVGMDGTESGLSGGVKVSVFDVNDMDDPQEVQKFVLQNGNGWAWSEALWDHHAFNFSNGVLAIPYSASVYDSNSGYWGYETGMAVLKVDPMKGIKELGSVNHDQLVPAHTWNGVRRSFTLEDTLVSISGGGLIFSELYRPERTQAVVALPEGLNSYYW